jgi:hypothetical protein
MILGSLTATVTEILISISELACLDLRIYICRVMGRLEQFAQRTFAEETEQITGGGAGWDDPPEIRLGKVQADGLLVIRRPRLLEHLTAPWPEAGPDEEVMLELKLAGNHVDRSAVERALLRRQARQVQRVKQDQRWRREEPLWLVAPHLPVWLMQMRSPVQFAPGCYWVDPRWHRFLWIAANELPLVDELIPFLLARSGPALDEFGRWVASRRPLEWVLNMLEYLPMTMRTREELLARFGPADEPEIRARRREIVEALLETLPETQQRLIDQGRVEGLETGLEKGRLEGQLAEAREALRRVLARRQLTPSQADDTRIEDCLDLATLERWLDQAITAGNAAEALL